MLCPHLPSLPVLGFCCRALTALHFGVENLPCFISESISPATMTYHVFFTVQVGKESWRRQETGLRSHNRLAGLWNKML